MSAEEINNEDNFQQEEVEDVEGRVSDFFHGLLGQRQIAEYLIQEEGERQDEGDDDFTEDDSGHAHPFVRNSKLYGQDFDILKMKYQTSGQLFTDPRFPPDQASLSYSRSAQQVDWLRPHQLCDLPQLFVDGADRFDVNQGELGDCWLLAAMSSLAMDHSLLHRVIPPGQGFDTEYVGMFRFRFWQYGEWVEVIVDDFLPCIDGKLAYIHSESKDEFWSALLEKAYAKLHGSYEVLKGGSTNEAFVDFSGGCSETYDLTGAVSRDMFTILLKAHQRKSMNGCSIKPDPDIYESKTRLGLIKGHAYTITKVVKARITTSRVEGVIPLIRVRNPWGNETEWRGIWADGSEEWKFIPEDEKENLGITFDNDGEWWMSYKDFVENFDQLEMCNLAPESMGECQHEGASWCVNQWSGEWVGGETAGGCRNFLETFVHNPQYIVTLEDPDDDDEDDLCTLIVSLMQKGRRALKHEGAGMLSIGFVIYKLKQAEQASEHLGEEYFKYTLSTARSKSFINTREVTGRFKLQPGSYVIVPSTYEPGYEGQFLLRTFTEKKNTGLEI
eukprot:GFUD01019424.1.p1 GENE.GFUD01019424.1~~GFUD01019424.1.p1  ORF type:complete len:557 (+),score=139.71 GFUD01019424.1:131-1801(+)